MGMEINSVTITLSLATTSWAQDVNWKYIRRSEEAQGVFWTSYVRSIYILCSGGKRVKKVAKTYQESSYSSNGIV